MSIDCIVLRIFSFQGEFLILIFVLTFYTLVSFESELESELSPYILSHHTSNSRVDILDVGGPFETVTQNTPLGCLVETETFHTQL